MLDKTPLNEKGQRHGHWLLHWNKTKWNKTNHNQVMFDFNYVNNVVSGFFIEYELNGVIQQKAYYAR
jgi:antitoxin component YwqK of YwqJK toxin-antitoxin module